MNLFLCLLPPSRSTLLDMKGTVDGTSVGVMLYQAKGLLVSLEIYAFGENPTPFPLPRASTLMPLKFED